MEELHCKQVLGRRLSGETTQRAVGGRGRCQYKRLALTSAEAFSSMTSPFSVRHTVSISGLIRKVFEFDLDQYSGTDQIQTLSRDASLGSTCIQTTRSSKASTTLLLSSSANLFSSMTSFVQYVCRAEMKRKQRTDSVGCQGGEQQVRVTFNLR